MATLSGIFYVGNDPELRYMPDSTPVLNIGMAYNFGQKGSDGKRPSQWIDAALIGKRANSLAPHIKKGTKLYATVEDPHFETYKRRDDSQGYKMVGRILTVEFAEERPRGEGNAQGSRKPAASKPASYDDTEFPF